ncbi:DNA helicase-2 / ATP-dependent DNA helicase PcrA [Anoxybacillus pushchinoensis]|uniref:DNA 3'-5' helicase n=1 Tax=Anoxybacillus pushchinoensis TaxID=150248 RepID=A0A1I0TEZ0_9BACL|nr:UvrD-helicase domain-containing protein [Anoxybacillus pushchinoensis]SFA50325.1 DNA helicase-2 / ATP-dependent DNA helicase PcrA [Anoxybacillus pushchinoensis]
MQDIVKKEQKRLDWTISVIEELIVDKKQKAKSIANDVVEAQLIEYAKKEVKKLQDIQQNPYFGRLDFEDEFGAETIYIGKKGVERDGELVVVDWRTDLGRLYNAYQGVQKTFRIGKDNRPVTINGKRGIIIEDGKVMKVTEIGQTVIVENEQGEKVKYMDDYLKEILTNTEEAHRLRDIIASIQAEQDEIIRLPLKDTVIVQGSAGSGKSTIALHRISYLLYQYHEQVKPRDILILAPNEIFLSYIKDIVPEIEIEGIEQRTFYEWASTYFTDVNSIPDLHEQYIQVYSSTEKDNLIKIAKYKGSLRFKKLLDDFVEYIGNTMIPHGDLTIESGVILAKEEIHRFYKSKEHLPLNARMKEVKDFIMSWSNGQIKKWKAQIEEEFEEAYRKWVVTLPEGEERKTIYKALENAKELRMKIFIEKMQHEISLVVKKMENIPALLMYKSVFQKKVFDKFQPDIDEELLSLLLKNGRDIKQEKFMYEDIAPLIYLDAKINGKKLQYEHIFIDEAQDYSPFQLAIMKDYAKSMTILGDIGQGIFSFYGIDRWEEIESYVFKEKEYKRLHLQTSYRSTKQIMDMANRVLLNSNYDFPLVIPVNRPGDIPFIKKVGSIGELYDEIVNSIRLFEEKGYKKIAILTMTKQGTVDTFDQLKRRNVTQIEAITEGHQELKEKIVIIPFYLVKGLEFDAVIIEDVSEETFKDDTQHAKILYMSITRAHHDLHMFYRGDLSPLLEDRDPNEPPKPRKSFADWLITDITDPYTEPRVEAMKMVKNEDTLRLFDDEEEEFVKESFEDNRERYYDFHAWLKVWRRWAELRKQLEHK